MTTDEAEAVHEERRPHPEAADHDPCDGRPDDPGEVEPGRIERHGARDVGAADQLHHERLARGLIDDVREAQGEAQHRHVPVLHVARRHQEGQQESLTRERRLGGDSSRRFGRRSATAPLTMEKSSTGENCKVARNPSLKGESVSWRTSQACATFCIQLPTCAASCEK